MDARGGRAIERGDQHIRCSELENNIFSRRESKPLPMPATLAAGKWPVNMLLPHANSDISTAIPLLDLHGSGAFDCLAQVSVVLLHAGA